MASTTGSIVTASTETKRDEVIESHPPSHILQDGRFIWLPEPTAAEKTQFLERSIARHKLLTEDLRPSEDKDEKKEEKDGKGKKNEDAAEPKIHPLAVASARVQSSGINELSKAINLNGLVNTDEFFGLTNIVNPLLGEATTTSASDKQTAEKAKGQEQEQRLRARFLGKRKRAQFVAAAATLDRHQRRLAASVAAQQGVDRRLQQLRPLWRLVAPEHGTRAKAHPVNPIETVAIDVDVYDRDRTGGGVVGQQQQKKQAVARHGIARRVPRYAVIELPMKEKVDVDSWKTKHDPDRMEMDKDDEMQVVKKTKAEPFAVADPTLGKIDVDFDPNKVPMLTLQLEIEKGSTGFLQFACLEPSALGVHGRERLDDEQVIVALQHSLFCASLFESIRTELAPTQKVWLSSDMEVNFLPPPTFMAGSEGKGALSMIHCHEGEVKVQLDCEYSLAVKLVEAQKEKPEKDQQPATKYSTKHSGSQTPAQLHALCRALLLHAQTVYHEHSLRRKAAQTQTAKEKQAKSDGHLRKQTTAVDELPPAHILQSCVGLGAKMLLERKVRRALSRVQRWCASKMSGLSIEVEWLPLPLFELASHLVISCEEAEGLAVDITIERDELTVTTFTEDGIYQKVQFHSANELEIFLKMALQRRARRGGIAKVS